jgi:hypothetical protein
VLTQDGRIAKLLIGEDSRIEKEYLVRVEGTLDEKGLKLLNHGLSLDGQALKPAKVSWQNEDQLRFVLREGKKRQIRRMCELVGLKVVGPQARAHRQREARRPAAGQVALPARGRASAFRYDAVFSANTLHIMSWAEDERLFAGLPGIMSEDAKLVVYGAFNYGGRFTSESNAAFDAWLKERGAHQGLRDFEAVDALARAAGLRLVEDRAMPSNNRCLVWQRACAPHPSPASGRGARGREKEGERACSRNYSPAPAELPESDWQRLATGNDPFISRAFLGAAEADRRRRRAPGLAADAPRPARRCRRPRRPAAALPARAFLRRLLARLELAGGLGKERPRLLPEARHRRAVHALARAAPARRDADAAKARSPP